MSDGPAIFILGMYFGAGLTLFVRWAADRAWGRK